MAAPSLLLRTGIASGAAVSVIRLSDRRPNRSSEPIGTEWVFQREIEAALYDHGFAQQNGAVYQLLRRSGVSSQSLPLKKACIAQGHVTQDEFDWMRGYLGDVRSFTLIPLSALDTALSVFGQCSRSKALVSALGIDRPGDWREEEDEEAEEEEAEDEEAEEEEEDEEEDGEGDEDDESDGEVSVAGTEIVDEPPVVYGSDNDGGGGDVGEADSPANLVGSTDASINGHAAKRQHVAQRRFNISPTLEAQLVAFDAHRAAPLNQDRAGIAVSPATRQSDRGRVLRFLKWLADNYKFKTPPTLTIFLHANIGSATQRYIKELIEQHRRKYSYVATIAASLIAAASFMTMRREAGRPDNGAIAQLKALHLQCRQQARKQDKFDVAKKPTSWLTWDAIQLVRCKAEDAYAAADSDAAKFELTREVTILRFLADQPPDRVGITRTLQLGGTLKSIEGGYELDLSTPGLHKTSAVFGATKTTIPASIKPWLDDYIALAGVAPGDFLFHVCGDKRTALAPWAWTRLVKAIFARHSDVALCPKDCRSSFITFLRSGEHDDETIRSAAVAMRHSSKTQASASYDKGETDRRVSAAMKVASDFSAKFSAGKAPMASSSSD